MLYNFSSFVLLVCALYVMGACLCRLRHRASCIKPSWRLLYVAVFSVAGWMLIDLSTGHHMWRDVLVVLVMARYMSMTRRSWDCGPPDVACTPKVPRFSYDDARGQIKTGDMIGIQTETFGGHIIQAGQVIAGLNWSHITHCAIAVWQGERLWVLEMGPSGNILKNLSQYKGKRMVVCAPPSCVHLSRFDSGLEDVTKNHIPYSALDLVRIGLRLLPMSLIDTRNWGRDGSSDKVCSLLPAFVYSDIGGDVSVIPPLAAPAEVVCALDVRFEVTP